MVSPILFAGGEDLDFVPIGSNYGSLLTVDTTAGRFRSGYARCGISITTPVGGGLNTLAIRATFAATTAFWFTGRAWTNTANGTWFANQNAWVLRDAAGVARLRIRNTGSSSGAAPVNGPYAIEKINAAGTATQLGVNTSLGFVTTPAIANKMDVFINYTVTGTISIYVDGSLYFTYSGDVTTDSATTLGMLDLCPLTNANSFLVITWSEVIVATSDTRNLSLVTQTATANGNTHNWTGGTASDAANTSKSVGELSPQYSGTAGQIDEYQVTPALPAGSFSVLSVVHKAEATVGASGPTKFDFVIRLGAVDYSSADFVPNAAWATYMNTWDVNPATTAAWATTDIVAASTSFNFGLKSVA